MGGGGENINRSNSIFKNIWKYLWKIMECRTLNFPLFFHRSLINASRFLIPHWLFFLLLLYLQLYIIHNNLPKTSWKACSDFFFGTVRPTVWRFFYEINPNEGMLSPIMDYEVMQLFHKKSFSVLGETMIQPSMILRLIHSCCKILFSLQKHCGKYNPDF